MRRLLSLYYGASPTFKTDMFKIAKGYDHVTKTVRLPEPIAMKLETLATENSLSLNQLVIQCIQYALDSFVPDEKNEYDCKQK